MTKFFCMFLCLSITIPSFAFEDLVELRLTGESDAGSAFLARKEITDSLVVEASKKLVLDLVGESEYIKKRESIDRLIKTQFGKFIPVMNPEDLPRKNNRFQMGIDFQLSRSSLRELLAKEGLLFEKTANIVVLPLVSYLDSDQAKSYKWWMSTTNPPSYLQMDAKVFEQELKQQLWADGFFLLEPDTFGLAAFLSPGLRVDTHRKQDMADLAKEQSANLVVYGSIRFAVDEILTQNKVLKINLKAILPKNRKLLAEVEKSWSYSVGSDGNDAEKRKLNYTEAITDLVSQIKDAWQKGKFSTENLSLVLNANLNFSDFESLKNIIKASSYQIKNLKERSMEKGRFELELDISGSGEEIVSQLRAIKSDQWLFDVGGVENGEVELKIQRK